MTKSKSEIKVEKIISGILAKDSQAKVGALIASIYATSVKRAS
jgi:hypothetical protein